MENINQTQQNGFSLAFPLKGGWSACFGVEGTEEEVGGTGGTAVEVTLDPVPFGAGSSIGTGFDGAGGETYSMGSEISRSLNDADQGKRTESGCSERS